MKNGVDMAAGSQRGVTLIELLVVMAIIGILIAVGVNMVGGVLAKHRLNAAADELSMRLRAARMLAVVHNKPVTVVIANTPGTNNIDSYHACIDNDKDGDCSDEGDYLNLDSGRMGALSLSQKSLDKRIDMYTVRFSDSTPKAVTFMPPSGLVNTITSGGVFVNGVVCFIGEIGDEDDDWDARYAYRRVTVNPVVGRTAIWRNVAGIGANPACRNNPEDDAGWERVD